MFVVSSFSRYRRNIKFKIFVVSVHIWTLSYLLDTFFSRENCCFWLRIIIERSFMVFVVQKRMTRLWENWKIIMHTQNDVVWMLSCWQSSCVEWQKIMILCLRLRCVRIFHTRYGYQQALGKWMISCNIGIYAWLANESFVLKRNESG